MLTCVDSLGGKTIIQPSSILRGDLRRPGGGTGHTVAIAIGKYSYIGDGCVLRPPYKMYKGSVLLFHVLRGPDSNWATALLAIIL